MLELALVILMILAGMWARSPLLLALGLITFLSMFLLRRSL